jgi:hypothetical protein
LHQNLDLRQLNQMYKVKSKRVLRKRSLLEKVKRKLSRKLYLSD